jgi:hypothetical protein
VANEFNARHPKRNPIIYSTDGKLVKKFKETVSVADKPRCGHPSVGEDTQIHVIANVHASPKKSVRWTSAELGMPKCMVHDIPKNGKFHMYKLQILHPLTENDPV